MKLLAVCALLLFPGESLKVASHEGRAPWYTYDQTPNNGTCAGISQCDGLRTCSRSGICQGVARPPKDSNYHYDENLTQNLCPWKQSHRDYVNRQYYCDGRRICIAGECQGSARF